MWHKFPGEKTQPDLLRKARFPFQHTMKTVKLKTIQLTAVKTARLDERLCFLTPGGNRRLKDAAARHPAATLRRSRQEAAACYSSLQRGDVIRGLGSWNSLSAGVGAVSNSEWPPDLWAQLIKDIRQASAPVSLWHGFDVESNIYKHFLFINDLTGPPTLTLIIYDGSPLDSAPKWMNLTQLGPPRTGSDVVTQRGR